MPGDDKKYLNAIPTTIPDGWVMVHNQVRPTRRLGSRGFRAWLQPVGSARKLEVCGCGWAPEHATHYRVLRG